MDLSQSEQSLIFVFLVFLAVHVPSRSGLAGGLVWAWHEVVWIIDGSVGGDKFSQMLSASVVCKFRVRVKTGPEVSRW